MSLELTLHSLTLRERRCLFTRLLCELVIEVEDAHPGGIPTSGTTGGVTPKWELVFDECAVHKHRRVVVDGQVRMVDDARHKAKSFHYAPGLAMDMNLYIDGIWITDGSHPAWVEISDRWKAKHPLCTAGIDFNDANHLSFGEGR